MRSVFSAFWDDSQLSTDILAREAVTNREPFSIFNSIAEVGFCFILFDSEGASFACSGSALRSSRSTGCPVRFACRVIGTHQAWRGEMG